MDKVHQGVKCMEQERQEFPNKNHEIKKQSID